MEKRKHGKWGGANADAVKGMTREDSCRLMRTKSKFPSERHECESGKRCNQKISDE